jgi:hypothetical protein
MMVWHEPQKEKGGVKNEKIRSFYAPISETIARQRAVAFLTQAGYRQLPDFSGYLHFKRGSIIGTLSNFNPTRWACAANVRITSEASSSEINVKTKITNDPFEKRFAEELLTAEFSRLEAAVTTNEFNTFDVGDLKRRIASYVYRVVGLFAGFLISVVLGIIAGMLALTTLNISPLTASAIGTGVFLILVAICLVAWGRQKKH